MSSNNQDIFEKLVDEGPVGADKLLNEDEVLNEEEKKKPEPATQAANNKPKKPCANCTCGLADKKDTPQTEEKKTSCGSCYLGDAFRCASCPYRGMPAFKEGEKFFKWYGQSYKQLDVVRFSIEFPQYLHHFGRRSDQKMNGSVVSIRQL